MPENFFFSFLKKNPPLFSLLSALGIWLYFLERRYHKLLCNEKNPAKRLEFKAVSGAILETHLSQCTLLPLSGYTTGQMTFSLNLMYLFLSLKSGTLPKSQVFQINLHFILNSDSCVLEKLQEFSWGSIVFDRSSLFILQKSSHSLLIYRFSQG